MDERLDAGRHHLANGNSALTGGYLEDGRSHFEAALLQFRGPELRLGEAHALRGLAHIDLGCGNMPLAEQTVRTAIRDDPLVQDQLQHVDREGGSVQLRLDAEEGEGASMVLLGDLLVRLGRDHEARGILSQARDIYESLGDVASAAAVWAALGRLYLREGELGAAKEVVHRALTIQEKNGDIAGQCLTQMLSADVCRVDGALELAGEALERALDLAAQAQSAQLLGRAGSQRAALLWQIGDVEDAGVAWTLALERIREAGDTEMEGFAMVGIGEVRSRLGQPGAVAALDGGTAVLAALEHQHGLGAAMLQVAHHALRTERPAMALAAAECARQLWQRPDPIRGVGSALRLMVKALAGLNQWPAVMAASHLRATLSGSQQPNAVAVRDFYRERASPRMRAELDKLGPEQLEARTDALIEQILTPILEPLDLDAFSLATGGGALALVRAMVDSATKAPATARQADPSDDEVTHMTLPSMGEFAGLYTAPSSDGWADAAADCVE
jgi:tetratricopeptide (TPR) repeat protein